MAGDTAHRSHRVGRGKGEEMKLDILHEVIPPNNILWDVLHSILEEEPILMAEHRPVVAFFKGDFINRITEGEIIFACEGI